MVNKFIFRLESQLADRNVAIQLDDKARRWLVDRGYDRANGARPMARLIAEKIKKTLADEVLFGKLSKGGTVKVSVEDSELSFHYSKVLASRQTNSETDDELVS